MLTKTAMKRRSTSPGEMLHEVLKPAGITQVALGREDGRPHPARERDHRFS